MEEAFCRLVFFFAFCRIVFFSGKADLIVFPISFFFVRQRKGNDLKGLWFDVGDVKAREKAAQALREASHISFSDDTKNSLSASDMRHDTIQMLEKHAATSHAGMKGKLAIDSRRSDSSDSQENISLLERKAISPSQIGSHSANSSASTADTVTVPQGTSGCSVALEPAKREVGMHFF